MNTLSNTEIVISLHSTATIKALLNAKPTDASLIAVNQFKSASIFYKIENGVIYADYTNGKGWEKVCQDNVQELIKDLATYHFILTDLESLKTALEAHTGDESVDSMILLKSRVDAQFQRVDARREYEQQKDGYWQGHYDAYEIVQNMIRQFI